jgi:hypothetical protein
MREQASLSAKSRIHQVGETLNWVSCFSHYPTLTLPGFSWLVENEFMKTPVNRAHFFRAAAQAMRRILVDRARHKASIKGGGGKERLNIEDLDLSAANPDERVLLVDESLSKFWNKTTPRQPGL